MAQFSETGEQGRSGKLYPRESDREEAGRRAGNVTTYRPLRRDDDYMGNVARMGREIQARGMREAADEETARQATRRQTGRKPARRTSRR
jgi:hypothetical protein